MQGTLQLKPGFITALAAGSGNMNLHQFDVLLDGEASMCAVVDSLKNSQSWSEERSALVSLLCGFRVPTSNNTKGFGPH